MNILLIEDDKIISRNIKKYLEQNFFNVDVFDNGEDWYHIARLRKYDLIICDIMLPSMNGIDICKSLRKLWNMTPIIILTAKDDIDDKIVWLNSWSDDYMIKPFSLLELFARINSLLRRYNNIINVEEEIICDDLVCNISNQTVKRWDIYIKITSTEYKILHYLLLKKWKVIKKSEIESHIWWNNKDIRSDVVRSHIQTLRAKIDKWFAKELIHNIRGRWYILDENFDKNEY